MARTLVTRVNGSYAHCAEYRYSRFFDGRNNVDIAQLLNRFCFPFRVESCCVLRSEIDEFAKYKKLTATPDFNRLLASRYGINPKTYWQMKRMSEARDASLAATGVWREEDAPSSVLPPSYDQIILAGMQSNIEMNRLLYFEVDREMELAMQGYAMAIRFLKDSNHKKKNVHIVLETVRRDLELKCIIALVSQVFSRPNEAGIYLCMEEEKIARGKCGFEKDLKDILSNLWPTAGEGALTWAFGKVDEYGDLWLVAKKALGVERDVLCPKWWEDRP